ncbi:MAG: hypothetical protein QX199_00495, partial [Methylococcaceae bacterium]
SINLSNYHEEHEGHEDLNPSCFSCSSWFKNKTCSSYFMHDYLGMMRFSKYPVFSRCWTDLFRKNAIMMGFLGLRHPLVLLC